MILVRLSFVHVSWFQRSIVAMAKSLQRLPETAPVPIAATSNPWLPSRRLLKFI
jgi:hypothetical protein